MWGLEANAAARTGPRCRAALPEFFFFAVDGGGGVSGRGKRKAGEEGWG